MFLPVRPTDWVCECGERRRFFRFSDGHFRLRCPKCGIKDVLEYLQTMFEPTANVEVRPLGKR
jgi:hypothetical protein